VIVHIDTSALIDSLTGPRRSLDRLRTMVADGHRVAISALVLFEWLRGPRTRAELEAQEAILPREAAVRFAEAEAALAAGLYGKLARPRGPVRSMDEARSAFHRRRLQRYNPAHL
jgi:predicted nucleic acid-binding protein